MSVLFAFLHLQMAYDFPGSWGVVKRNLPGLLGAGVGAIAGAVSAGQKAYREQQRDARVKFDTWSERPRRSATMPGMKRRLPTRRSYSRRSYRRYGSRSRGVQRMVRFTDIGTQSIAAGTTVFSSTPILLSNCKTSDIIATYRYYRIRKCVLHLVPRIDPANSGLANNFQAFVAAACDPEDTAAPTAITDVTAYDNSFQKWVTSGDRFTYTFYPKVINTVDNNGVATAAGGYGLNPWLACSAAGVSIRHQSLKIGVKLAAASTVNFDLVTEVHFDVKGTV